MVRAAIARLADECVAGAAAIEADGDAALDRVLVANPEIEIVLVEESIVAGSEEILSHVRRHASKAALGLLMTGGTRERVFQALHYGATAVLLKDQDRAAFREALSLVLNGKVSIPRELLTPELDAPARSSTGPRPAARGNALTRREREVMDLIGLGYSVPRIAVELKMSPHTVRVHVTRMMKKLDLRDRSSLIHHAVSHAASRKVLTRPGDGAAADMPATSAPDAAAAATRPPR